MSLRAQLDAFEATTPPSVAAALQDLIAELAQTGLVHHAIKAGEMGTAVPASEEGWRLFQPLGGPRSRSCGHQLFPRRLVPILQFNFLFFGYQKWFAYEVQRLISSISNGPLIFWLYPVLGMRGATLFLGASEWTFGTLLLLGFWNKKLELPRGAGLDRYVRGHGHDHPVYTRGLETRPPEAFRRMTGIFPFPRRMSRSQRCPSTDRSRTSSVR